VHIIRQSLHIVLDAFYRFDRDDGWAIASYIALSILMSVFPFLIVVTTIAAFIGSVKLKRAKS
jgi:membrane protein